MLKKTWRSESVDDKTTGSHVGGLDMVRVKAGMLLIGLIQHRNRRIKKAAFELADLAMAMSVSKGVAKEVIHFNT